MRPFLVLSLALSACASDRQFAERLTEASCATYGECAPSLVLSFYSEASCVEDGLEELEGVCAVLVATSQLKHVPWQHVLRLNAWLLWRLWIRAGSSQIVELLLMVVAQLLLLESLKCCTTQK